jgi:hypothetical protein
MSATTTTGTWLISGDLDHLDPALVDALLARGGRIVIAVPDAERAALHAAVSAFGGIDALALGRDAVQLAEVGACSVRCEQYGR